MGRGSYLGGSTVLHPRSGWFSRSKKKAPMSAADSLRHHVDSLNQNEDRRSLANRIVASMYDGAAPPELDLSELIDCAQFQTEFYAFKLRWAGEPDGVFQVGKVRSRAKYEGLRHFSLWRVRDEQQRTALGVCWIRQPRSKLMGFTADEESLRAAAPSNGWFVGDPSDLDRLKPAELRGLWHAARNPAGHPIWSRVK